MRDERIRLKPGNTRFTNYPIAFIAVLFSTTICAQLKLDPEEIDVNDVAQSRHVRVTNDGRPILPGEI